MMDALACSFCIVFILGSAVISMLILAGIWWRERSGEGQFQVVVLGDAGRSPRMQYHCLSLVQLDYNVDLVAYGGQQSQRLHSLSGRTARSFAGCILQEIRDTKPRGIVATRIISGDRGQPHLSLYCSPLIGELMDSKRLTHHVLSEPPSFLRGLPRILQYALKVIFQTINLFWTVFFHTKKPSHVLMQNPPAIPTLFVMVVICLLRGSKLIVDYHNYGHTVLALSLGKQHALVKVSKVYEKLLCGFAYANLCVSQAMKKDLARTLGIDAVTFYDRPSKKFHPTPIEKQHKLFQKLAETEPAFRTPPSAAIHGHLESVTLFTECTSEGKVSQRKDRPFLVISSTSWTEDEDFGILLQALEIYNEKASKTETDWLPKIMCIITGKGPLKEYYQGIIAQKNFSHVTICTLWLSAEDYPLLLGSADLGVCLHKSSSGLDLPMKVVDMFGSGLPVCAVYFNCLHELLRHEHNGLIFNDHKELAEQLQVLSQGFPSKMKTYYLQRFRDNLSSFQSLRWDHYWKLHVLPIISPPQ